MGHVIGYSTCFVTGLAVLILELIAFRLLAPYFGVSSYVVGAIINTILLALAIGYLIGGYIADRIKSSRIPYLAVLAGALYLHGVYLYYPELLRQLASYPVISGSFIAIVVLFFVPMVLLAFVPPYLIKLLLVESKVGAASGLVFSISTLGSIVGGLLTTFYFIPQLGSQLSLLVTLVTLYILAALGLFRIHKAYASIALLAIIAILLPPKTIEAKYIFSGESEYNVITVVKAYDRHLLLLNDNLGIQSVSLNPENSLAEHFYTDYFLFPSMLRDAKRALILGNAAGTTMISMNQYFATAIDGVEIDPVITELGQQYFGLDLSDDKLRVIHQDGRVFLNQNETIYDIVAIDMYGGGPYIPFHVATQEFFNHAANALTDDGILVINLPYYAEQSDLENYYLNTIGRSFKTAFRFRQVLYAFKRETSQEEIVAAIERNPLPPALQDLATKILGELEPMPLSSLGEVFTDDYAPLDRLTFEVVQQEWLDRERAERKLRVGY